jgi:serine/threonine protein kinase
MTLLERLRSSLQADYDVRESLGRGGMGAVFLATDRALDKPMAIKVLLPEIATARAVERFLREARALAAVKHPRVVQVHRAGEADGLYYYVMELAEGETLADRLARGPLTRSELDALAEDLLSGLEAIHAEGIVHRDVKPSNIFLVDGRAMLGDFGVALVGDERITATEVSVGTPRYQAPEQRYGQATKRTDLYAAGLVLYEACTGRHWRDMAGLSTAWDGVPGRWRRPLHRALETEPSERWPDADVFRRALRQKTSLRTRVVAAAIATAAAAVLLLMTLIDGSVEPGFTATLAVVPFRVVGEPDSGPSNPGEPCNPNAHTGCLLAHLVTTTLSGLSSAGSNGARPRLTVIPFDRVSRIPPTDATPLDREVRASLGARYVAQGPIYQEGDSLRLILFLEDSLGQQDRWTITGPAADRYVMANKVAQQLIGEILPQLSSGFRGLEQVSTENVDALVEYVDGEYRYWSNAWELAEQHYRDALAIDSTFALAWWRLWNVYRWRITGREVVDLDSLLARHGDRLPTVERDLLDAEASDPGNERIDALEELQLIYDHVSFLHWLLADELHHRGPLIGRPLDDAIEQYNLASIRNPYFGPVYEHSLLALIRLGRKEDALRQLDELAAVSAPPTSDTELYLLPLLQQAVLERFEPERAADSRASLFGPGNMNAVIFASRMALWVDLPEVQLDLGRQLVAAGAGRADGHRSQGLALMVLGRPQEALGHFDAAAAAETPSARRQADLEAAEWRVVFPALGLFDLPPSEFEQARERLAREASSGSDLADRAAWALALDACGTGNGEAAGRWSDSISGTGPESARLRVLARACAAHESGRPQQVLDQTEPLLGTQFLVGPDKPADRDPFTRTVLHVLRAEAYEEQDRFEAALHERYWADNSDITRDLEGPIQAVEVDWAASPYSDRRRAQIALEELADTAAACHLLGRLEWLWTDVEESLQSAREADRALAAEACR